MGHTHTHTQDTTPRRRHATNDARGWRLERFETNDAWANPGKNRSRWRHRSVSETFKHLPSEAGAGLPTDLDPVDAFWCNFSGYFFSANFFLLVGSSSCTQQSCEFNKGVAPDCRLGVELVVCAWEMVPNNTRLFTQLPVIIRWRDMVAQRRLSRVDW